MMVLRYFIAYYVLKVYDRVATERKVHIFQGRDGDYNFSAVVKDATLIRFIYETDGIYVRNQRRNLL